MADEPTVAGAGHFHHEAHEDHEGVKLDAGYRLDLIVENAIVVEVKAVEALTRLHEAQILTYLRLSGLRTGFLMNFNVTLFKNGLRRFVL